MRKSEEGYIGAPKAAREKAEALLRGGTIGGVVETCGAGSAERGIVGRRPRSCVAASPVSKTTSENGVRHAGRVYEGCKELQRLKTRINKTEAKGRKVE